MNEDIEKKDKETGEDKEEKEEYVSKKAFEGIRNDLIQTRTDKTALANQLSQTQEELRSLRDRLTQFETKKETAELDALLGDDPDEPVTTGRLLKAWRTLQAKEEQKKAADEYNAKKANFTQSVNKMRLETQDKAKYGLDWDSLKPVIERIYSIKASTNRYWESNLLYENNPAKVLYDMALQEPEVQEKVKIMKNDPVLKDMETRKTDKTSVEGSSSPKPGKKLTLAQVAQMTPAETLKHKKEIEELLKEHAKSMKK